MQLAYESRELECNVRIQCLGTGLQFCRIIRIPVGPGENVPMPAQGFRTDVEEGFYPIIGKDISRMVHHGQIPFRAAICKISYVNP